MLPDWAGGGGGAAACTLKDCNKFSHPRLQLNLIRDPVTTLKVEEAWRQEQGRFLVEVAVPLLKCSPLTHR